MTAMAHYHVVKEKSRHTHRRRRRREKKGSKKKRSSHKTGDFLFAFFIYDPVTSQVHKTLNQYNAILIFLLPIIPYNLLLISTKGVKLNGGGTGRNSFLWSTSYCVCGARERVWWVHKTGNRTLNTYTTIQSCLYITVGGSYKEDGLYEDANDQRRKKRKNKRDSKWRCFPVTLSLEFYCLSPL